MRCIHRIVHVAVADNIGGRNLVGTITNVSLAIELKPFLLV